MESNQSKEQEPDNLIDYATQLLVENKLAPDEVRTLLMEQKGIDKDTTYFIVKSALKQQRNQEDNNIPLDKTEPSGLAGWIYSVIITLIIVLIKTFLRRSMYH